MTLALGLLSAVVIGVFVRWVIYPNAATARPRCEPMGSLRCSGCGVSWPTEPEYRPCPECLEPVSSISDPPIDKAEAHSRMTHAKFERWLDANGRRHPVEELERIPVKEEA